MASKKAPRPAAYQVGPDVVVGIEYEVFDAEGDEVGTSDGPFEFVFGYGEVLPEVERALEGRAPGEHRTVRLEPEQAFGKRDPKALIEVDKSEFPDDVAPGDDFEAEAEGGERVVLRVLDVGDDFVVLDRNHPLAGQSLRVEVRVTATRPATAEEREAAAARLAEPPAEAAPGLIPAGRLLLGPTRR